MKTYMFPGQGSQYKGMGGDLFDEFKDLIKKADKILGYSIKELCLEDPRRELNKTQFTQPALYVVNALSYLKAVEQEGTEPDYLIGHSLGEFNALMAAKCFSFESGLKLVKKRGELMSQATDGGMAAILNGTQQQIEEILEKNDLKNIDLANFNTRSQIVISGSLDEIGKAQYAFQDGDILYYPLNTSGAFHSRFMEPSKEKFAKYLKKFKLSSLAIPVISNVTALPYDNDKIVENLSNQIATGVRWSETIEYLLKIQDMEFVEMGGGDVLTKMVDKIKLEIAALVEDNVAVEADDKSISSSEVSKETSNDTANPKSDASLSAEEMVKQWNDKYAIGTKVKSTIMDYDDLETRSEAVVLFGHRAAVYMKEYNGYFDLEEVVPA